MKKPTLARNTNRDAISGWEGEGGAAPSDAGRQVDTAREQAQQSGLERTRLDVSHDSDGRGEHRYPDAQQTSAERKARQDRDDLKKGLAAPRQPIRGRR